VGHPPSLNILILNILILNILTLNILTLVCHFSMTCNLLVTAVASELSVIRAGRLLGSGGL
jgi:hypothetical protein